jgi:hypothetical protein
MLRVALLLIASLLGAAAVAQPDPLSPEAEVRAVEQKRYRAMIDGDVETLESVLADELRYVHANGSVDSKYEFIASLDSGNLDYEAIDVDDQHVNVYGQAAVVSGTSRVRLLAGGAQRRARLIFTAVYVRGDSGWRLVAYQSTESP